MESTTTKDLMGVYHDVVAGLDVLIQMGIPASHSAVSLEDKLEAKRVLKAFINARRLLCPVVFQAEDMFERADVAGVFSC